MITIEIDGKEAWYSPVSHSWLSDDRLVTEALRKTLPKKEGRLHSKPIESSEMLSRALKSFPHAKVIKSR